MKAVSHRLFWNSESLKWILARDMADAKGCKTTILGECSAAASYQRWLAPKEWAADIIGCREDDFVGMVDEYYGHAMVWTVTALLVNA